MQMRPDEYCQNNYLSKYPSPRISIQLQSPSQSFTSFRKNTSEKGNAWHWDMIILL